MAVSMSVKGANGGGCALPARCVSSASARADEWRRESEVESFTTDESVSSSSIVNLGAIDATVTRRVELCDDEEASKSVDS